MRQTKQPMEKQPTNEESLLIIRSMIDTAKEGIRDNGFMYLLWGWLVFVAAIGNYVMMKFTTFEHPYVTWPVLMISGGIVSTIYGFRKSKTVRVRTYVDTSFSYLWSAYGISLFMVLFFTFKLGLENAYPIIMILYAIGTFVSGGILRFKPLIFGGIACWVLAAVSFFLPFEFQLLTLALSVLLAYIIPGHLLKISYNKATLGRLQTANS
jgi:hypothetical protein